MKVTSSQLTEAAIWVAATSGWVLLHMIVIFSPGFGGRLDRYFLAPVVLCGMTWAIYRLIRGHRHAWSLSALFAGFFSIGTLFVVAAASHRWS